MKSFILLALPVLAFASPVADRALEARDAIPTVPQQIPTGSACAGVPAATTVSPAEVSAAVAPCIGVQPRGSGQTTRNDIVDGICKPFTLIFARGTTEDPNLGNIVGPPFVKALNVAFGGSKNVAVQGVNNYAAIGPEYCAGGSLTGSQNLASLVQQTMTQCPKTKLCVSGYSQGAQVVHNAFQILKTDPAATRFVNSVITFGDPDRNLPVGNVPAYKVKVDCHAGDNICENGSNVLVPHLTYCRDVGAYAAFAKLRSVSSK
ncbi:hypothetical protein LTR37_008250 [Vermiconidia calcicola]|uniref:Uncharacterized protein n=1 Tax=Vermiconidia calcicola TaxID=1690605 RepID=A0ACC3NB61_9PEZI|nr:hypothetical protein LTR37_008250 [Vermiconidia calcicola]